MAVDDVLDDDDDEPDPPDDDVVEGDGVDEVDVLEPVVDSDGVVDTLSFFVSPEPPPAAGADSFLAAARESVL